MKKVVRETYFVVAGNHRQFRECCREYNPIRISASYAYSDKLEFIYLPEKNWQFCLMGINNPKVIYYGSWYERDDIEEIVNMVKARTYNIKEPTPINKWKQLWNHIKQSKQIFKRFTQHV